MQLPLGRIVGHCKALQPAQIEVGEKIEFGLKREVSQGTARRPLVERQRQCVDQFQQARIHHKALRGHANMLGSYGIKENKELCEKV